jgi:Zn-dependent protease
VTRFQKGLRIATIAGIPIYLHVSWFVIFALVTWSLAQGYFPVRSPDLPVQTYWAQGLVASLLLFASVLAHELGHAFVARRHEIGIGSITLFIFGGLPSLDEDPRTPGSEFWIAVAGPITSLAVAAVFAALAALAPEASGTAAVAGFLAYLNVVLAVFNMVPAFPLDGGRVLRAALWKVWGWARGTRVAVAGGTAFVYLLIGYGIVIFLTGGGLGGVWAVLIGWFVKEASAAAGRQTELEEIFADVRVGDVILADLVTVPAEAILDRAVREYFERHGHGRFPVERNGEVVGLLSLSDVSEVPPERRTETTVENTMTPLAEETSVDADQDILTALRRMGETGGGRLLVREGGRAVGMATRSDVLWRWRVARSLGGG